MTGGYISCSSCGHRGEAEESNQKGVELQRNKGGDENKPTRPTAGPVRAN